MPSPDAQNRKGFRDHNNRLVRVPIALVLAGCLLSQEPRTSGAVRSHDGDDVRGIVESGLSHKCIGVLAEDVAQSLVAVSDAEFRCDIGLRRDSLVRLTVTEALRIYFSIEAATQGSSWRVSSWEMRPRIGNGHWLKGVVLDHEFGLRLTISRRTTPDDRHPGKWSSMRVDSIATIDILRRSRLAVESTTWFVTSCDRDGATVDIYGGPSSDLEGAIKHILRKNRLYSARPAIVKNLAVARNEVSDMKHDALRIQLNVNAGVPEGQDAESPFHEPCSSIDDRLVRLTLSRLQPGLVWMKRSERQQGAPVSMQRRDLNFREPVRMQVSEIADLITCVENSDVGACVESMVMRNVSVSDGHVRSAIPVAMRVVDYGCASPLAADNPVPMSATSLLRRMCACRNDARGFTGELYRLELFNTVMVVEYADAVRSSGTFVTGIADALSVGGLACDIHADEAGESGVNRVVLTLR